MKESNKELEAKRMYLSAPLPFVGQKRRFADKFIKALGQFSDGSTFVDLFGGSGLLSHIAKHCKPHSHVVYNDFDNYRRRLAHIPQTNAILREIRAMVGDSVPRGKPILGELRERILSLLEQKEKEDGFVDFITLSPSLLFSMKYRLPVLEMRKETFYNRIRTTDIPLPDGYLDGLDIVSCDYKELFNKYKGTPGVVFLVDPPYLSTEAGTYTMYWKLADYLDVLNVLKGHSYVFFTSNKSDIVELCEWMGSNNTIDNPFDGCVKETIYTNMNYQASYSDLMLYKRAT